MTDLPLSLYTVKDIRRMEAYAISMRSISGDTLMARAAKAAFSQLKSLWPQVKTVDVFCGTGNNGGDGLVLARLAKESGMRVTVYEVGGPSQKSQSSEVLHAKEAWKQAKGEIQPFEGQKPQGELIVDAILGIGAKGTLAPQFIKAIEVINESPQPVFAIDLPSGLHADSGDSLGSVVHATATITFLGMKLGLLCNEGINTVGQLFFDNLGVTESDCENIPAIATRLVWHEITQALPHRKLTAHKGDFGHVCIVGGGQCGYSGAVSLSGESALRAGAGLVSAIVAPESLPLLARAPSELMCYGPSEPQAVLGVIERATVLVIGPGLSQTPWGKAFFDKTIGIDKKKVIDADGLNWLAQNPQKSCQWILTPHPGEAARLLNQSTCDIQKNRFEAARALKEKYGGVIVLKGAGTIIVDEDNTLTIQAGGFPVLATGGTGDVLAGLIGGLLSQGLSLSLAAKIGVSVHANAAKIQQEKGERGMLASDLFLSLRSLLNP